MLYVRCPTCGRLLGNVQIPYETELSKICNDKKLTQKEKDNEKRKLLDKMNIPKEKYCCRMRVMTFDPNFEEMMV